MKKIKVLLMILLFAVLLVGCQDNKSDSNKDSNNKNSNSKEKVDIKTDGEIYQDKMPASEEDIIKNIDVKLEKAKDGTYVAFITNNNKFVIPELEINVDIYKGDNKVDTLNDGHDAILPGYTVVSTFESYEKNDNAKYELSVDWDNNYINHSEKVKIETNLNSSKDVIVTLINNDNEDIEEAEIIAVFYDKEGNLLGTSYSQDIYDISKGKSKSEKLYLSDYDSKDKIETFKVYLNQAHTF